MHQQGMRKMGKLYRPDRTDEAYNFCSSEESECRAEVIGNPARIYRANKHDRPDRIDETYDNLWYEHEQSKLTVPLYVHVLFRNRTLYVQISAIVFPVRKNQINYSKISPN